MKLIFLLGFIAYSWLIWLAYCNARASRAPLTPVGFYFHIAYKWWWTPEMRSAVLRWGLVIILWLVWQKFL